MCTADRGSQVSLYILLRIMRKMHTTLHLRLRREPAMSKNYYQKNSENVDLRCDIMCFLTHTPNNEISETL